MGFDVESLGLAGSRLETTNVMKPIINTVIAEQLKQAQIKDPAYRQMLLALVAKVTLGQYQTIGFSGSQGSGKSTLQLLPIAIIQLRPWFRS